MFPYLLRFAFELFRFPLLQFFVLALLVRSSSADKIEPDQEPDHDK